MIGMPRFNSRSRLSHSDQKVVWHLHRIFIPRRSITGRLVVGIVWRRRERQRWIYRKVDAKTAAVVKLVAAGRAR